MLLGKRMKMMSGGDVAILGVVTIATGGKYMKYKKGRGAILYLYC